MTAIIDYDAGNLKSVEKALRFLGDSPLVTRDPEEILAADRVILPGVGAFGAAMERLNQYGLTDVIRRAEGGFPFWESAWGCSFCLREARRVRERKAWVF